MSYDNHAAYGKDCTCNKCNAIATGEDDRPMTPTEEHYDEWAQEQAKDL